MKSELTTVILFGEGDTRQEVRVEYDLEHGYLLTKVKVLDTVVIEPSDLDCDVTEQIALQVGVRVGRVKLDCEIEIQITAEETVKL